MILANHGIISSSGGGSSPIVTSGLTLNLDAGNISSYPGTGTTWSDLSTYGNNGTLVNGVAYSSSNNGILVFDGVNDYVSVNDNASIRFGTGGYSINIWVNPSLFSGSKMLIQKGSALGGWQIYYDSSGFLHFTQQFVIDIATIQFSNNQWKNIVFTSNGGSDRNIYMYVNGTLSGTYTCNADQNYNSTSILTIGADGVGGSYFFNGAIPNVLLYNRKIDSTDITQNYNALKTRYGL